MLQRTQYQLNQHILATKLAKVFLEFKQLWCFRDQYGNLATLEVQYQPRIDQKIVLFYDSLIN